MPTFSWWKYWSFTSPVKPFREKQRLRTSEIDRHVFTYDRNATFGQRMKLPGER